MTPEFNVGTPEEIRNRNRARNRPRYHLLDVQRFEITILGDVIRILPLYSNKSK